MAKAQILIVEDEVVVAESIRNRLESLEYDVPAVVASGEEAIEKAGETHPNLILMDVELAGDMDGIEAAEQIRARFHIPVIYLTAFADDETLRRAKITEPYGYILKPLQLRDLRSNIEMALYKHEMESKLRESEGRYRQFVENSPNPVFSVDRDGIIQTWNRACERIFQYESGEIVGQAYHELLWNSEDRPAVNTMLAQVWQGRSLSNENMAYRSKDGTRHFTVSRLYPLRDPKGNVLGCVFANTNITERRRAETELRQRTAQLEALREVGLELTAELDLDALLHSIASWAVELLGGTAGAVDVYRPDQDVLELVADTPGGIASVVGNVTHVPGEGLSGKVWESGEALVVGDYERWEGRLAGWKGHPAIVSVLGVPICWHEEFLGVLSVASDVLDAFSPGDVELLDLLATQAAIAIRNARLFDEARRRAERLAVVNRIARVAGETLHLDDLIETVSQQVTAIFQSDAFFIALYDEETNELDFLFSIDEGVQVSVGRSPLSGLMSLVVAEKKPLVIRNLEQEPDYRQVAISVGSAKHAASWIGVPLLVGERVIGVLNVQSYRPNAWSKEDELLLSTIADQVAVAVKSVQLYEETRQRAIEQETAGRIAYALNTLDFQTAFPVLVQGLRNLTDCERVSLALLDDTGENFTMATLESPFPALEEGTVMPISASSAFNDITTGRPHLTPDLSTEMDLPGEQALYQAGFRSRINLPLLVGGETIGALNLASCQPGAFWENRLLVLRQIADAVASAIENNRLFQAECEQRELAKALEEAAAAVGSTLDLDRVLDRVLEQVERVVAGDAFNIVLVEEGAARITRWRAQEHLGLQHRGPRLALPVVEYPNMLKMMRTGKSLVIPDTSADPDWVQQEDWEWVHSYVGAPIQLADSTIGFLSVDSTRPGQFGPADAQRLEAFTNHVATAIENARLYEQAQCRLESLMNLNLTSQVLASSLDMKQILEQIVNLAGSVVNSDYTSVVLLDENGQLTRQADDFRGLPPISQRIRNNGVTRYVLDSGQSLVIDIISDTGITDPPLRWPDGELIMANPAIVTAGIRSFAAAPIQVKGKTMGVMYVHSRELYTFRSQLSLLTTFVNQAAVAVENAHLFQAEQEQRELAEALAEAAAALDTLNLDQVLDRILEQVERIVAGDASNIMLLENGTARAVRWRGYEHLGLEKYIANLTISLVEYPNMVRMAETGEPFVIPDTIADPDWTLEKDMEWWHSYVGAPIRVGGVTVGFLNVNGTRPGQFGPADARRLQVFANHTANAVANARLHQQVLDYAEQLEQRVQERTTQLVTQYARLEAIMHSTADGIISTDEHGNILHVNPVARTWLTYSLSPEDVRRLQETVRDLAQRAAERPATVLELTGRDLELKTTPISKPGMDETLPLGRGEPAAVVAIHDISELKAMDRMKTSFIKNASHELRTPITTIKLYAHIMRQASPEDERWSTYLDALVEEVDNQAQIVEAILQLSRIYAGRMELEARPVFLNELIEIAAVRYQSRTQKKGITLKCRPTGPGPVAAVDTGQMMQVLNNLVEDAIRYTPEGGRVTIATGQAETEGRVCATMTVSNTGEHVPERDMPHIFERLLREGDEEPHSQRVRETGLRLMVVKEIVELHGGRVTVESQQHADTTFTVWLPLAG